MILMEPIESKLRLAYYDAPDGPRVMIFGPVGADFRSLRELFARLGRTSGESCELHEQPFVASFGGTRITLTSSGPMFDQTQGSRQGIRRVTGTSGPVFAWHRTLEGWDYLAKLIDALAESPRAGHQYLTNYPSEDAIVVVSKGEYGDEVLQGE